MNIIYIFTVEEYSMLEPLEGLDHRHIMTISNVDNVFTMELCDGRYQCRIPHEKQFKKTKSILVGQFRLVLIGGFLHIILLKF